MRIISLAPTQTEIIAALNCENHLAGITENCDHPAHIQGRPAMGSWWAPDLSRVIQEKPDLVCTFGKHQEEMATILQEGGLQVYHSDPGTVRESLQTIEEMAVLLDCEDRALTLLQDLHERLARVNEALAACSRENRPRVFRIMNWKPLISVGPGSFQHDVIELAGGRNVMGDGVEPYMVCVPQLVMHRNPQAIFFCEHHLLDVLRKDTQWQKVHAVKEEKIFIFDCGLTCRSGPRIVDMVEGLASGLHPELFTSPPHRH